MLWMYRGTGFKKKKSTRGKSKQGDGMNLSEDGDPLTFGCLRCDFPLTLLLSPQTMSDLRSDTCLNFPKPGLFTLEQWWQQHTAHELGTIYRIYSSEQLRFDGT